ncbi:hypothetical protein PSECIP111951_04204 [Pseudoalteromonas holothuriae]|uniref:Uncharacterized protein n=1 Tax=Pseudoalteromonas holothuriae TaxID=2963714 RepID=A0ABM9GNU7_9GAMM|nr:hypothetical protein PSECIP111951_04204 [Pseudoalteromonas sp. CIP111951]
MSLLLPFVIHHFPTPSTACSHTMDSSPNLCSHSLAHSTNYPVSPYDVTPLPALPHSPSPMPPMYDPNYLSPTLKHIALHPLLALLTPTPAPLTPPNLPASFPFHEPLYNPTALYLNHTHHISAATTHFAPLHLVPLYHSSYRHN